MSMDNSIYDGVEFVAHDLEGMRKQYDRLRYDHQLLLKHLTVLQREVKAWRKVFDDHDFSIPFSTSERLHKIQDATDESGALIERN